MLIIFCSDLEEAKNIKCPNAKIVITGSGLCNVIQTPKLNVSAKDKLINIGYAGSNKYKIGEVKGVIKCQRLTPSLTIEEPIINLIPLVNSDFCYTADDFIEQDKIKEIPLVDMELYYLASIYPQITALKIVSDNLNYTDYKKVELKKSWDFINEILNTL